MMNFKGILEKVIGGYIYLSEKPLIPYALALSSCLESCWKHVN